MSKMGKKKDGVKNSYFHKLDTHDDVKAELEAMCGLEYNLHGDKDSDVDNFPLSQRKLKMTKATNKINDKITMENDKLLLVKEKIDMESTIPYLSSTVTKKELRNVIEQAGNSSEDRYKILEARDRLMRLRRKKIHTLETAKTTIGTCPDMCPEKERLMREFQRQVASYELLDDSEYKINHDIAVKQYSRSSADQEEPMPQDLRPVNSLKMTMSYLLHEIVDLCEEESTNLAEWYHFLWDRTRGIRKDITQQELCCVDTVKLVEECARFHIVCSERLCAEELSVFDKKINTENLTKCLQTLKYMYHDLRVKGINCKNEPEFRAYIILLNLNDANFMWDLQRLPSTIQKSPEVNFAVRVYSAIQSNNYAKFFKLIKKTTYLNACILLRYFFQVRVQALDIMVKAYCRKSTTAYPLYEFIDILAFDDENEAIYFCEQSGLKVSDDEMYIILNRNNILSPSTSDQGRAKSVVEAKRISIGYSIGQVIAGGVMPEQLYINHKPHNSFDSRGYLKTEAVNASDQCGNNGDVIEIDEDQDEQDPYEYIDEDVTDKTPSDYTSIDVKQQKSPTFSISTDDNSKNIKEIDDTDTGADDEIIKFSFASALNTPKINELSTAVDDSSKIITKTDDEKTTVVDSSSLSEKQKLFDKSSKETNIFANVNPDLFLPPKSYVFSLPIKPMPVPFIGSTVDRHNLNVPKAGMKVDTTPKKELTVSESKKIRDNDLADVIARVAVNTANEIETQVIQDICSNILKQNMNKDATHERLCNKIFDDLMNEVVVENCENILKTEMLTKKKIESISNRMKNRIVHKYYMIWCKRVFMKKQQRNALENTPVWLSKYSLDECAKKLYNKEQNLVIQNMRRKRKISINYDNDERNFLIPVEVQIYNGIKNNVKRLNVELSPTIYWKMVISWPNLKKKFLLGRYKRIMSEYFSPSNFTMDPIIKTYKPNSYETLNICIKHMDDDVDKNNLMGADGLFFIATTDEKPKSVGKRLTKTILSRQKLMQVPLFIVILGDEMLHEEITPTKQIKKLIKSGYISEYIVQCETKVDESIILKLAQSAINWLTHHKSSMSPLEMNSLSELINSCLTDELWLRISGHASFNVNLSMALENPQFTINMHNEAVNHLIDIVNDPESLMYTNFPSEFKQFLPKEFNLPCTYEHFDEDWKSAENRNKIERIIQSFSLPPWPFDWPIDDTIELHKCIIRYCDSTMINLNCSTILNNIISNIIYLSDEKGTSNFIHIILEISKERLRNIDESIRVVYNKKHIKYFQTLPWWFESNTLINFIANVKSINSEQTYSQLSDEPAIKKRRIEQYNEELPQIIHKYSNYLDNINSENLLMEQSHYDDIFNISQLFENNLSKQLSTNNDFEKKLDLALHEVDMIT